MVKADAKRDYYADLDLQPTAEHEEIKKQFRLLAKLYHPDRNPGHETEFVGKFQALQAAHEILADPAEKKKYDLARAKYIAKFPPPPKAPTDPYGYSKPTRASTMNFPPPPKPQRQYTQAQEAPASAGAAKFNAFTRAGNQTWDRQRYEDAARAEAARSFTHIRNGQQTPEMPPRPPRPHPTAPRPASSDIPNGANPGFPGMSRTTTTGSRRSAYEEVPRSAYSHVRATRVYPSQSPADHWTGQSPPETTGLRPSGEGLRHTKSSDPDSTARPGMFDRQPSRYASGATHLKTDVKEGLYRSASVRNSPARNSPVDPSWEDCLDREKGPFGRPKSHQPHTRHRSASPNMRQTSGSTVDFSESESDSSGDDHLHPYSRKKAQPRPPRARTMHDGLDSQASFKNYTRVVHDDNHYAYPPPQSKQPTRAPFPDVTSPDEVPEERSPFRYALFRASPVGYRLNGLPSWAVPSSVPITRANFFSTSRSKPDPVFREANFKHENWAEKLRTSGNTSPVKQSLKMRGRARTSPATPGEPMDVDMGDSSPQIQTNGVGMSNMNDLKAAGPFGSTGLNGVDDLKTSLPFESRASGTVPPQEHKTSVRLRLDHLPRPPKEPLPPSDVALKGIPDAWKDYCKKMTQYLYDWKTFDRKMIDHFVARQRHLDDNMAEDWVGMHSDGPTGNDVDCGKGLKAGHKAYMEWIEDDRLCHEWWEIARMRHAKCMAELGHVRGVIKGGREE